MNKLKKILLKRIHFQPCTAEDLWSLSQVMGVTQSEIIKEMGSLIQKGLN